MEKKWIKVINRKHQCMITIPIALARKTGFHKAKVAKIWVNSKGSIEVAKIGSKENKED